YTYTLPPAPTVTGITPDSGAIPGRESVTIAGTDLQAATSVHFGTTLALPPFTANADGTALQVTAPASCALGAVPVTVTTAAGTSTQDVSFTYTAHAAPPITAGS